MCISNSCQVPVPHESSPVQPFSQTKPHRATVSEYVHLLKEWPGSRPSGIAAAAEVALVKKQCLNRGEKWGGQETVYKLSPETLILSI